MNEYINCAYPQCVRPAAMASPKGRKQFCTDHADTLCLFANTQPVTFCSKLVIPHSAFCLDHDREMMKLELIHKLLHEKMALAAPRVHPTGLTLHNSLIIGGLNDH